MNTIIINFVEEPIEELNNDFVDFLSKEYIFKYSSTSMVRDLYNYLYKEAPDDYMSDNYMPGDEELLERFRFVINGQMIKAQLDYNLNKFILNHEFENNIVNMHYIIGLPGGNGALIKELAKIRINPDESNHKHIPHVHIYKPNNNNICVRIELNNFIQMKGDKINIDKLFSKKEQKEIFIILKENQEKLINFYEKVQKGEYVEPFYIEYNISYFIFK